MRFFEYVDSINDFFKANGMKIDPIPQIILNHSDNSPIDPFIRTGTFDYEKNVIELYITNRHVKDILRSYCHELIHANQFHENKELYLKSISAKDIANDVYLTKLESDAYLKGNVLFRQWTEQFNNNKR